MSEKATVTMNAEGQIEGHERCRCTEMSPKELMLYAAALCSAKSIMAIMKKEQMTPRQLEITYSGEAEPATTFSSGAFLSFHVTYRAICLSEGDEEKASRAIRLAHDKYCTLTQMLRKIAPISHEIAIVNVGK